MRSVNSWLFGVASLLERGLFVKRQVAWWRSHKPDGQRAEARGRAGENQSGATTALAFGSNWINSPLNSPSRFQSIAIVHVVAICVRRLKIHGLFSLYGMSSNRSSLSSVQNGSCKSGNSPSWRIKTSLSGLSRNYAALYLVVLIRPIKPVRMTSRSGGISHSPLFLIHTALLLL